MEDRETPAHRQWFDLLDKPALLPLPKQAFEFTEIKTVKVNVVYASLAVTCHLRFWQNDRGLLRATAVTWGWNGYRNKSQHRKSTL